MSTSINISNYEAYVIDYLDGTLDASVKSAFEAFLLAHPDIAEELDRLKQMPTLYNNINTNYNKEALKLKIIPEAGIDEDNYEEHMALSADGINHDEWMVVDALVKKNPALKRDWNLYQKTILSADKKIIYPSKNQLKRSIPLWSIPINRASFRAAAAIALLLIAYALIQIIQDTASYVPRTENSALSVIDNIPEENMVESSKSSDQIPSDNKLKTESEMLVAASSKRSGLQKIERLSTKAIQLTDDVEIPQRTFIAYKPTIPQDIATQDSTGLIYAGTSVELNLNQFVGKTILGLDPEKTKTTTALVRESLIKTMNEKTDLEFREHQQANRSNTKEFLAGNFGVKRITYPD